MLRTPSRVASGYVIGKVIKTSELPDGKYEMLVELEAAKFKMQEGAKFTAFLATSVVKQRQLGEEPVLNPGTFHFQTETPLTVRAISNTKPKPETSQVRMFLFQTGD